MNKVVMRKAVRLAKQMEGNWQARMKMALTIVWKLAKQEKGIFTIKEVTKKQRWTNYGHDRLYVAGAMVVTFEGISKIETKEVRFEGYYDIKNNKAVREGGNSSFKSEIFEAIRTVASKDSAQKTERTKTNNGRFIIAKFDGFDAETGERISAGDHIFFCEVNGGYCLADNF